MLSKLAPWIVIAAAGYWYWTGPYQQGKNPSYEERLRENAEIMKKCERAESYKIGATGEGANDPEQYCAELNNFYEENGQWHSYEDTRP